MIDSLAYVIANNSANKNGDAMKLNIRSVFAALCLAASAASAAPIPALVQKDGRHALMVDGAPYLVLGLQAHNSSNYPEALKPVWAAVKDAHANTLEMPVAW